MNINKTFYIHTLGCKVNQYESQVIRENFLKEGYAEAEDVGTAEICVVNTCTVTYASDSKSFKLIRDALRDNKCVIATGCLAEDEDLDLRQLAGVKFIIKNKDKYRIPEIVAGGQRTEGRRQIYGISGFKNHTRTFVKIQDGCDNTCSYCKVRLVRGRSRSRPYLQVLKEAKRLIKNGSKEIVLSGICLGAYGKDLSKKTNLSTLIDEACKIEGNWRLRLSSIEPKDINDDLIHRFKAQERLCKHIHMPFQSGDDDILRRMNRPYKSRDYLDIVYKIRKAIPDIAISTDIMVGFPQETDKNFQNTLDFIKEVQPMRIHVFMFSKRIGTEAHNYRDNAAYAIKKKREDMLLSIASDLSKKYAVNFIDRTAEVLIEHKRSREGCLQGYTDRYIRLFMDGHDALKGELVKCRLTLTNGKVYGILSHI